MRWSPTFAKDFASLLTLLLARELFAQPWAHGRQWRRISRPSLTSWTKAPRAPASRPGTARSAVAPIWRRCIARPSALQTVSRGPAFCLSNSKICVGASLFHETLVFQDARPGRTAQVRRSAFRAGRSLSGLSRLSSSYIDDCGSTNMKCDVRTRVALVSRARQTWRHRHSRCAPQCECKALVQGLATSSELLTTPHVPRQYSR